ncbi:MAG: NAD(P)-dependent oxidoreductase, partial [Waterburya sp.]
RRAYEGQQLVRQGKWTGSYPTELLGTQVTGKRLGILGMGRIGRAVAQRAKAFGMEVHYCNRQRVERAVEDGAIFHENTEELLKVSDFLSFHCPATPETTHFLNTQRIELLPDGAIIINAARGSLIVDEDLIAALRSRKIQAAGLDVFENEPNLHPDYLTLPNVFLLPHLGSATLETRSQMGLLLLDNLDAIFAGKQPPNVVNS